MADKEKSTKTKADKTRILVLFLFLIILIVGIIFAYLGLKQHQKEKEFSAAQLKGAPSSIESIPGLDTATQEYTKTQHQENLVKAQEAAERAKKTSSASVPTITRPALRGDSSDFLATQGAPRAGCSQDEIKRARTAGVSASELRCKGCSAKDLETFFTPAELKQAGFSAADLKASGLSAAELKAIGFTAKDLIALGYTPNDLAEAGYTVADLKKAGVSLEDLRKMGVDPAELRAAGFTAAELLASGVSVADLKKAGYGAKELKDAGASIQAISEASFSPMDLLEAGATDEELAKANVLPDKIKALRAELAAKNNLPKDCSIAALTKARADGISATALTSLKCDAAALKAAGYTAAQLKAAGFNAKDLKAAGYTAAELKAGGFNAAELKAGGFSGKELKDAGFTATELKAAGLTPEELKDAGYSAGELKDAGFTAADLRQAGYTAADLLKAGMTPSELRATGYTAEELKAAGISPTDLKAAGFTDGELVRAGFTPEEINQSLLKADPAKLRTTGYGAVQLKAAGFTADKLRVGGYTAAELLAAGYSPEDLKKAGFSDDELLKAGVSAEDLDRLNAAPIAGTAPAPSTDVAAAASAEKNKSALTNLSGAPGSSTNDASNPEKVLERLQKRQAAQMSTEQQGEALQQIQTGMANQANELFASWNPPSTQQYVPGDKTDKDKKDGSKSETTSSGGKTEGKEVSDSAGNHVIKAGSVMFAVLDTGINSDEMSPILATIVQGPLKGARLLGQFSRTDKKVLLSFTTMSLPQLPTSLPVNTVAIDPDTARTAVSSSVNNHYLLRYGTLFASSFLTGFAGAVAQSGATTNIPQGGGSTIITQPPLETKDKIAMALGSVGTQYSAEMGKNFSTPPTVKVESGAALGILFMSDLTVPKEVPMKGERSVQIDD